MSSRGGTVRFGRWSERVAEGRFILPHTEYSTSLVFLVRQQNQLSQSDAYVLVETCYCYYYISCYAIAIP